MLRKGLVTVWRIKRQYCPGCNHHRKLEGGRKVGGVWWCRLCIENILKKVEESS
jgi:hypothetical protein